MDQWRLKTTKFWIWISKPWHKYVKSKGKYLFLWYCHKRIAQPSAAEPLPVLQSCPVTQKIVWRQAITDESLYSDCVTGWSISAPLGPAPWLTWRAQRCSPARAAALARCVKDNHRTPQLPSSKMSLHVSNTNKPSVERWQSSRTKRRHFSKLTVFWHTTHCWLVSEWPFGGRRLSVWRRWRWDRFLCWYHLLLRLQQLTSSLIISNYMIPVMQLVFCTRSLYKWCGHWLLKALGWESRELLTTGCGLQ